MSLRKAARRALERTEQEPEPVAHTNRHQLRWVDEGGVGAMWKEPMVEGDVPLYATPDVALYTHPPRREWQGISDKEIAEMKEDGVFLDTVTGVVRFVEAMLKARNT